MLALCVIIIVRFHCVRNICSYKKGLNECKKHVIYAGTMKLKIN